MIQLFTKSQFFLNSRVIHILACVTFTSRRITIKVDNVIKKKRIARNLHQLKHQFKIRTIETLRDISDLARITITTQRKQFGRRNNPSKVIIGRIQGVSHRRSKTEADFRRAQPVERWLVSRCDRAHTAYILAPLLISKRRRSCTCTRPATCGCPQMHARLLPGSNSSSSSKRRANAPACSVWASFLINCRSRNVARLVSR